MPAPSAVRVGLVLPESFFGEAEWRNAERALAWADEADAQGVRLLLFPEGYPGPMTGPLDNLKFPFDPVGELKKKAKAHSMYIVAGNVMRSDIPGAHLLALRMFGPEGKEIASYRRMQPDTPPLNAYLYGGKAHLLPGDEPCVVETEIGRVGLQICSELFIPELTRLLMLRGAEIIVSPVYGVHNRTALAQTETRRCMARAPGGRESFLRPRDPEPLPDLEFRSVEVGRGRGHGGRPGEDGGEPRRGGDPRM